jgi:hypothetical protein
MSEREYFFDGQTHWDYRNAYDKPLFGDVTPDWVSVPPEIRDRVGGRGKLEVLRAAKAACRVEGCSIKGITIYACECDIIVAVCPAHGWIYYDMSKRT